MRKNDPAVKLMYPEDLEEFIKKRSEGSYLLLDVRQPEEYEESHLAGSKLVSLPDLSDSLENLDPEKDIVVYCAVGGRSLIAAKFLAVRGFKNIFQLEGGIEAWENRTASGPVSFHLEFIRGDETPLEAVAMAFDMEEGLEKFHRTAIEKTTNPEVREILAKLAKAEEAHKKRLGELRESLTRESGTPSLARAPGAGPSGEGEAKRKAESERRMEGGLDIDQFMTENASYLESAKGCLELAMMIEVQALDLYLRMAETSSHHGTKEIFFGLGDEEKSHLRALGELLGGKVSE